VLRLPALTYLVVLLLVFATVPLAVTSRVLDREDGTHQALPVFGPRLLLLLIPVLAALFIARTATVVDRDGIRIRALLGSRRLTWEEVRGLSVTDRSISAVCTDGGSVRLPCVRVNDLGLVSLVSGDRLPRIATARPKQPPERRRRR